MEAVLRDEMRLTVPTYHKRSWPTPSSHIVCTRAPTLSVPFAHGMSVGADALQPIRARPWSGRRNVQQGQAGQLFYAFFADRHA
mmetsp:Transcript_22229/g.51132  ORF Transcript_22229/g.51132 Transcript_22229/m.51132 type:complete len:84 (+) Transcript_22229:563-814(+)